MKTTKIFFIVISFLLAYIFVSCEERLNYCTFKFKVYDNSNRPLDSVSVIIQPTNDTTMTNIEGNLDFNTYNEGEYSFIFSKKGYNKVIYRENVSFDTISMHSGFGDWYVSNAEVKIKQIKMQPSMQVLSKDDSKINEIDITYNDTILEDSFYLYNTGEDKLLCNISSSADWVKILKSSKVLISPNEKILLQIYIDREKLNNGENIAQLNINFGTGDFSINIKVYNVKDELIEPQIKTLEPTLKTDSYVSLNGIVINMGNPPYTECGFVYGLLDYPTIGNGIRIPVLTHGEGEYSALINTFEKDKIYSYRTYVIVGNHIIYGDVMNFELD